MCVGLLRRNSRVEEVPGTLPQPRGLARLPIRTPGERGCRNSHGLSRLPSPPPSRAAKPCRGLTMPIGLPPPGVLDAALLVSTDMDMACSTLSQRASSPAVQSEVHGAESRAPRAGAGWPRDPRGCRCRPCMAAGHSPPVELGASRSSPSPAPPRSGHPLPPRSHARNSPPPLCLSECQPSPGIIVLLRHL